MQKQPILLKFQAKYCPGDMRLENPSGSAGVLEQLNGQNMECFYFMECVFYAKDQNLCYL